MQAGSDNTMSDARSEVRGRGVFSVIAFLIAAAPIAYAIYLLAVVVPRFEMIFKDFGTKLPGSTQALIDLSRAFDGAMMWLVWLIPVAAGLVVPRLPPHRLAVKDPAALARLLRWLIALLAALIAIVVIHALANVVLQQPLLKLMDGVSGARG